MDVVRCKLCALWRGRRGEGSGAEISQGHHLEYQAEREKKQRGKLSSALARNANVSDRNIESSTSQFS